MSASPESTDDPARQRVPEDTDLLTSLLEEFCRRWQSGEALRVEQLLDSHGVPRLAPEELLELIAQEFVLREEAGQTLLLAEYQTRFPQLSREVELQLAFHRQLGAPESVLQVRPDRLTDHFEETIVGQNLPPTQSLLNSKQADRKLDSVTTAVDRTIGGYRILREIGRGGMGHVYEALDERLKRRVALKVIRNDATTDPQARARFLQEAQAAAAVQHDHLLTVYQIGEDQGQLYMALPLLEGETLAERLQRTPGLTRSEQLRILRETAEGLAAAHRAGLVHRDIKPSNLWLEGSTGRVKILDFGLARLTFDEQHLTNSGIVLGTPAYMAPEQADAKAPTPHSDLFSLGCVAYHMLAGKPPFLRDSTLATLSALAKETPPAPHTLQGEIPSRLSQLVMRLLERDPRRRPQSAEEVVTALRELEVIPQQAPRRLPLSHRQFVVVQIVLVAVSAVVLITSFARGWWTTSDPQFQNDEAQQATNSQSDVAPKSTPSKASPPQSPFVAQSTQPTPLKPTQNTAVSGKVQEASPQPDEVESSSSPSKAGWKPIGSRRESIRPSTPGPWKLILWRDYRSSPDKLNVGASSNWGFRNGRRFEEILPQTTINGALGYNLLEERRRIANVVAAIRIKSQHANYGLRFRDIRSKANQAGQHLEFWVFPAGRYELIRFDKSQNPVKVTLAQGKIDPVLTAEDRWHVLKAEVEQQTVRLFIDEQPIVSVRETFPDTRPMDLLSVVALHFQPSLANTTSTIEVGWEQVWELKPEPDQPTPAR